MRALPLLLLLGAQAASAPASRPAPSPTPVSPAQIAELYAQLRGEGRLAQRLITFSRVFRGSPYVISPLGEGPGAAPDPDPRLRLDAFDCTTYVETVLALALARDPEAAAAVLDRIRYRDGQVGFATRKHFPMAQWIPDNVRAGLLRDITVQVGGDQVVWARKRLGPEVWARRKRAPDSTLPELSPEQIPVGEFKLPVIPIAVAPQLVDRIPSGAVISVVRADFRSIPVRVSHQGLVIHRRDGVMLRHAAHRTYDKVVDERLDRYLEQIARYGKWPVTGINLLLPRVPPGWDDLLAPELIAGGGAALPLQGSRGDGAGGEGR